MTPEEEKPTYNNSLNQDSASESDSNQFQADPQATISPMQPDATEVKPKKPWPLTMAWVAFMIENILFLIFGFNLTFGLTSLYVEIFVFFICLFALPLILVLAGISICFTYKKFPEKMRTVCILVSNVVIEILVSVLAFMDAAFSVLSTRGGLELVFVFFMVLIPVVSAILLVRDKKKPSSLTLLKPTDRKAHKTILIILLTMIIIELSVMMLPILSLVASFIVNA